MPNKRIPITVRMSEETNQKFKHYVIDRNTNMTEVVVKLIEEHLEKEGY